MGQGLRVPMAKASLWCWVWLLMFHSCFIYIYIHIYILYIYIDTLIYIYIYTQIQQRCWVMWPMQSQQSTIPNISINGLWKQWSQATRLPAVPLESRNTSRRKIKERASKELNITCLVVPWLTSPNQKDDVYRGNNRMDSIFIHFFHLNQHWTYPQFLARETPIGPARSCFSRQNI